MECYQSSHKGNLLSWKTMMLLLKKDHAHGSVTKAPNQVYCPLGIDLAPYLWAKRPNELMEFLSWGVIHQEILIDQGPDFTLQLIKELCYLLRVKTLRTDLSVEQFHRSLMATLKKFVSSNSKCWDQLFPHFPFSDRKLPQASKFSPFQLLFGKQPLGFPDLLGERWRSKDPRQWT